MAEPEFRHAIVACARWEEPYIVEWLNYYRLLGFDHVFLYCNDDEPGPFYQLVLPFTLGERPFVSFRYYPEQGRQARMYAHFLRTDLWRCGWVSFFDIDEFLRLPAGRTIGEFMRDYEDRADCVLFNWLFFGTSSHKTPPDGLVLENYTRREAAVHCLTKYVARAALFDDPRFVQEDMAHWFWHWPGYVLGAAFRPVNVVGEDMSGYFEGFPARPGEWVNEAGRRERILKTAVIHHYSFRSERSFWDRAARGMGGEFNDQRNWRNLAEGDSFSAYLGTINAVEDLSLAAFWAAIRAQACAADVTKVAMAPLISRGRRALRRSVTGRIDATAAFHAGMAARPWWQVDLGGIAQIEVIKIFNVTGETAWRLRDFWLSVSIDGESWVEVAVKQDGAEVAEPFVWTGPGRAWARFVRVTSPATDDLDLDRIEVYGRFAPGGMAG